MSCVISISFNCLFSFFQMIALSFFNDSFNVYKLKYIFYENPCRNVPWMTVLHILIQLKWEFAIIFGAPVCMLQINLKFGAPNLLGFNTICTCMSQQDITTTFFTCHVSFFFLIGRMHNVAISLCSCEPEAAVIVRYYLWPTQPSPKRAISMELMRFIYYLKMEAHVSLKAACQVIGYQNNLHDKEVYCFICTYYFYQIWRQCT